MAKRLTAWSRKSWVALLGASKVAALALLLAAPAAWAASGAPMANPDSYTVNEDTPLTVAAPGVLGNDTDTGTNTLSTLLSTNAAHGALTLNANGSFTYRPGTNYNGLDSFVYRARDASSTSAPVTVTITINPVNDVPVVTNDTYSVNSDTPLVVTLPGVLANDADVDGDPLSALLAGSPAHGTLALSANGSFNYSPAAGYAGSDSFTYSASDGQSTSAVATVTITVVPAPIVVSGPPQNQTACIGDTAAFSATATGTALTYQWLKGTSTLSGKTNSTLTLTNVSLADAGAYSLRVTGATNAITNSATLTVNTPVTLPGMTNLVRFIGSIAIFNTATNGTGPLSVSWLKNGAVIASETNLSLVLSNLTVNDMATYSAVVKGPCGNKTNSATLTVAACFPAVDVMIIIDRSGSMSGQPYTDARTACTNLIRNLQFGPMIFTVGRIVRMTL